ncbi:MAG: hypothetical protein LBU51_02000 [Bacteroidales bacterium]|jgi:hypothetical protein|nr:hypothetical protein [Bacteroidales bacterium]
MAKKKIIPEMENSNDNEKQNTLKVEIISNKSLFEILGDTKRVWKIILVLFILVFTIFIALTFVTIAIKSIYPYNDIKINALGATTMQNEDKEVIYWLFNTVDLWANSGIKVKKGDILTIRASGRSHTAIHHLVDDAENNKELDDKWVSTDGEGKMDSPRDKIRAQYRIFKNKPQDALLMQVVPDGINIKDTTTDDSYRIFEYVSNNLQPRDNYYYIGKEREDLLIHRNGILHFAVNDIVLTDSVIEIMQRFAKDNSGKSEKKYGGLEFGPYPDSLRTNTSIKNEMTYYKEKHYYNAWFDDNVGSFLIVIERKKSK